MQKKLIALAVAAALTAPALALADSANVTFYGVLDADVENVKSDKVALTAPGSRGRITSNASRFGLKGEEDLGDGLKAIFQVESRVNLVGTETTATSANTLVAPATNVVNTNLGVFNGMRNSNIGLKGDFGTAFLGHWDTPFKTSHNKVELFDNTTIATATALLGSNKGANAFNLRQNSSFQYWSPVFSGFQIKGAYSAANATVDTATNLGTPAIASASAAYDQDGIYIALATEQHKAVPATAVFTQKDSANRLVAAYTTDVFQVGITAESMTINLATGNQKRNAYALSGKYIFGANSIGASYTQANDFTGGTAVVNNGAKQVSLRYGYAFTKRTEAYAMYTQIANKAAGTYNFTDVATFPTGAGVAGAKVSGFGMGLRHTF
jgi:predicted porin